jgi:cytochrome P450
MLPPNGPRGHFLLGNLRDFTTDTLAFMLDVRQYGDFVQCRFGPFPFYVINHPDLVHEVLVTNAAKFYKSRVTKQVLYAAVGKGLFTNDGDSWKRQRKLSQPAFHTTRIAGYAKVMVEYARNLIAGWESGRLIDLERDMNVLTMQIVSKTLFDAQVNGEEDELSKAVRIVLRTVDKRFNRLLPVPEWLPLQENKEMKWAVKRLDEIIQDFIDERRRTGEDKGDLLSMLIAAQDDVDRGGMSDKQLRDEAMTVFGAGHETTSGALTWTFYLLSQHPEVEAKLLEELEHVLKGRVPTFEDLQNLCYTEMVIKESMRLYPPAWGVSREAVEDLTVGQYAVDKGQIVLLNIYGIHRDSRFFSDPDRFLPERFSPENEKLMPKYAYLPFGAGPRICIGNAFAMMEAKLLLATIVQQFHLSLAPGQQVAPERVFTLRPKYGMKMIPAARTETVVGG